MTTGTERATPPKEVSARGFNTDARKGDALLNHKKPTRRRKRVQPKVIAEWLAVLTALLTAIKLLVELIHTLLT